MKNKFCPNKKCSLYAFLLQPEDVFCPVCGTPLRLTEDCSYCGKEIAPWHNYCTNCGERNQRKEVEEDDRLQSRLSL